MSWTATEAAEDQHRAESGYPVEMLCACGHEWATECVDGVLDESCCEMCNAPGVRDD